jgi:predicted esterase
MIKQKISITKTARYFSSQENGNHVREIVFVLHGYAQLADEFLASFDAVKRSDLLIVAPEGLHRFYAKGSSEKVVASWMTKEDREDDIADYVNLLDTIYAELIATNQSVEKIRVLGFSQGAATASRWCALSKNNFHELILYCGFFPPDLPPTGIPSNIALTVLTASDDRFVSAEQEKSQLEMMCKSRPDLRHIRFEGKHEIDSLVLRRIF